MGKNSESKSLGIVLFLTFAVIIVLQVQPVFADVPVVNSITPWIRPSDSHTILNITVTHRNYFSGHYVDWVSVDVSGTANPYTITLSEPQPVDPPSFVVQFDMGVVTNAPSVQAMAHCTIHGSGVWSAPAQVREGGLFNPHAPFLSDLNLILQIVILIILVVSLAFKFRRSYAEHGATMGVAVGLHTISILLIMVPSLWVLRSLFENSLTRLPSVILLHAVLGSLVEILGVYLVGVWALRRLDVKSCFRNKMVMLATIILWISELILGIYVYALLYPF